MERTDVDELQKLLETGLPERANKSPIQPSQAEGVGTNLTDFQEHKQWELLPNGVFAATGTTQPRLSPGAYTVGITEHGRVLFYAKSILTDSLIDLGDSNSKVAL